MLGDIHGHLTTPAFTKAFLKMVRINNMRTIAGMINPSLPKSMRQIAETVSPIKEL
jgi:predicted esterase YcpF (UPF0227 family)